MERTRVVRRSIIWWVLFLAFSIVEKKLIDHDLVQSPELTDAPSPPVLFSFPATHQSDDLPAAVGQFIHEAQQQSILRRGRFCVALSGGSMPKILAEALIGDDRIVWDKW
jgi:hypothetical protein